MRFPPSAGDSSMYPVKRADGELPVLLLGTAQLGLPYGIVRETSPSESDSTVRSILEEAAACGFGGVDTAMAYGAAPRRLGDFLESRPELSSWRICTKLIAGDSTSALSSLWKRHMDELRRESVFALLLHRSHEAESPLVRDFCIALRAAKSACHLGVSVYDMEEVEPCFRHGFGEVIELPLNAFSLPYWERANTMLSKSFVIARSVFLQGALLQEPSALPNGIGHLSEHIVQFRRLCASHSLSPLEGALCVVLGLPWVSAVTVGVDSTRQIREIAAACAVVRRFLLSASRIESFLGRMREVASFIEPSAIDPRLWKT